METHKIIDTVASQSISKVLYTGRVHITGGRDGAAKSHDGRLSVNLTSPGAAGNGTNPEQLFASGWSACFIGAMQLSAKQLSIVFPKDAAVDAEVDLAHGPDGYALQARLNVSLPGLSIDQATALIEMAHQTCPYSKATRDNINVEINLI